MIFKFIIFYTNTVFVAHKVKNSESKIVNLQLEGGRINENILRKYNKIFAPQINCLNIKTYKNT